VEPGSSAADLDSYQWLENLPAQALVNRRGEAAKPAARLRRFRRVVDSVLRRSQVHLLSKRPRSNVDVWCSACKLDAGVRDSNIVGERP